MRIIVLVVAYAILLATAGGQEISPLATAIDGPVPSKVMPGAHVGLPPSDAIVLFNGNSLSEWENANGGEPQWLVDGDVVTVVAGSPSIKSKRSFSDVQLHIEWRSPTLADHSETLKSDDTKYIENTAAYLGLTDEYVEEEAARYGLSQYMANSGIFLQERYEVQVLETFGAYTYINGQAGAVYKQHIPLVTATNAPGEWQTYDIIFQAPRFGESETVAVPARLTLLVNGVLVHNNVEIWGTTQFIGMPQYEMHGPAPIRLQSHPGVSQISYRNIWVREL